LTVLDLNWNDISDVRPLAGLTALTVLDLDDNNVTSLSSLSSLTELTVLEVKYNNVMDLSPLVANTGLGPGDVVELSGNPVDCALQATNIRSLVDRGVSLDSDCISD
jgi:internalin A